MAEWNTAKKIHRSRCSLRLAGGKLYYSRQLERKIFFALTLAMLLAGIGYRALGG